VCVGGKMMVLKIERGKYMVHSGHLGLKLAEIKGWDLLNITGLYSH